MQLEKAASEGLQEWSPLEQWHETSLIRSPGTGSQEQIGATLNRLYGPINRKMAEDERHVADPGEHWTVGAIMARKNGAGVARCGMRSF